MVQQDGDCWIWTGGGDRIGYGRFYLPDARSSVYAHRWSYEYLRHEIPPGLQIDHLCRRPSCVNPWHMEPVTARVNNWRSTSPVAAQRLQTHCKNGHEFTPRNTYPDPRGRKCRKCRQDAVDRYRSRRNQRGTTA